MSIYVTPIDRLRERMDPTALNFLGDVSGSMNQINREGVMCDAINQIFIPGLKESHKSRRDMLRVCLGAFADEKIEPLTKGGYYSVDELLRHPISNDQIYKPGLNRGTALYASIIKGIRSCVAAARIMADKADCTKARAALVVITDGQNESDLITKPADVRSAIGSVNPAEIQLDVYLAYFKTREEFGRSEFIQVGRECGIPADKCYFMADHGSNLTEQRKAFRRLVEILSRLI